MALELKPRRKRRPLQPTAYHRQLQKRSTSSDPAKPPTWRAWKARNGGKSWHLRAPLAVEWSLEWFVYRLRSLALFDLLELAGKLTVLVAVIFWFLEADNRAKERHYRAWELINAARGSTGDGGRKDALQDLNEDGVSLASAPLEQAYLTGVDLKDADLKRANLRGAFLGEANLESAFLGLANLEGAFIGSANLKRAWLVEANLQGANLSSADLRGAFLGEANLQSADVHDTNITQEQIDGAYGDDRTQLPDGLTRPAHWSKAEETEDRPAIQPDDAERRPPASGAPGADK